MTVFTDGITDRMTVAGLSLPQLTMHVTMADLVRVGNVVNYGFGVTLTAHLTASMSLNRTIILGPIISDTIKFKDEAVAGSIYAALVSTTFKIKDVLQVALGAVFSDVMVLSTSQTAALGLVMTARMVMRQHLDPNLTFQLSLTQALQIGDELAAFAHLDMHEAFTVRGTLSPQMLMVASFLDAVQAHDTLAPQMVFNLVSLDTLSLTDDQLLQMIFSDEIDDTIEFNLLYVSPDGGTTTWAINTRTNAISQYTNYDFNSFALMGRKYVAASSQGLFELNGLRDGTENIEAVIRGGFLQLSDGMLSGLMGVYIGARTGGGGPWYLKLTMGDGRDYTYQFMTQPNLMTTKVSIGKGLNARYVAYELTSTGPDFDLDEITFVPMVRKRRV